MDLSTADGAEEYGRAPLTYEASNARHVALHERAVMSVMSADRPPHFPDPNVNPIAVLEARIAEQDEMIAGLHREARAWQAQAEAALARLNEMENKDIIP